MHPDRGRWGSTTTVHGGTAEIPESAEARNRMKVQGERREIFTPAIDTAGHIPSG